MDDNQPPNQIPADPTAPQSPQAESPQGPVGKVLLVEDDMPMVKMYTTRLMRENLEVQVAYDGEEALKKAMEWLPDLVVLDLMIPKIGGMEVLEQLHADQRTKDLPVIILSNLSQDQDIERAQQLGAKEFLIKANFTPSQVIEKIKEHLKRKLPLAAVSLPKKILIRPSKQLKI
jgi:DNA-binding response OmpR family regulator